MEKHCVKCGKLKEHQAKGFCRNCYIKYSWNPKKIICKRCKRELSMHAKGFCGGCYNYLFRTEQAKAGNSQKRNNLDIKEYQKITKKCVVCGFNKVVELHHLDHNHKNNSETNLIGLCPNHHKMVHVFQFRKEMREILKEKGYNLPKDIKLDFSLEN